MPRDNESIVILGAGHAGIQAAARLRELHFGGSIIVVDGTTETPYERPPLSKEYLLAESGTGCTPLRKGAFYETNRIELRMGVPAESIDRDRHEVVLTDGSRLSYTKLIIATGSAARKLTVPGSHLEGIHSLKTREDAARIKTDLGPGRRAIIIGAGYIGLEVAGAARKLGSDVTVLEFQDRVMSRVTSEVVSKHFEALHREQGVEFLFGAGVTEVRGSGRVQEVITSDGTVHPADLVVAGIGVVPRQELAERAGIECRDGILIDASSATSDPDIYAVGDVARLVLADRGIDRRLESIPSAQDQALKAADSIMGAPVRPEEVPWFWTVQHGVRLQTAGLRAPDDEIVVRPCDKASAMTVLYMRDGRLAALDAIGSLRDFQAGKRLVAQGASLDLDVARDGARKLAESALV
jgi:3-phenylpropionate/trans-cinnamate dioxygenase ferredoxin reductase component